MDWIKCRDCLPGRDNPNYSQVVGRVDNGKGFVIINVKDDPILIGEYAVKNGDEMFTGNITHWSPLLQPE